MDVKQTINSSFLVPVVVIDEAERALPTAKALLAGGVNTMEITMRTKAGLQSIEAVAKSCPEILVGAGTVITLDQCKQAVQSGAKFIVSPGFCPEVVRYCVKTGIEILPGCVTPTEIMAALDEGVNVVKFFPANVYGGLGAIKALAGPFPNVKFVPTGGVGLANLHEFIHPAVFAVGGGWLCERGSIQKGEFDLITQICKNSVEIVNSL